MRSEGYCSWVCLSVCLLSHISPLERLFVLKTLSRTQRATKVKTIVGFSLKPLRCRDPALPVDGHTYSRPFFLRKAARMRIIVFTTCGGGPKRPFLPSSCAELKVVVSFVSCHWSCLQARSVHNVMLLYR